ncbi:hypothetical protein [Proteiniborus sp.]|uniref:hypothetical protein n=1 Tax=Proteiniborus sp. TaxID=2079015 RepID=UPI00332D5311
MVENLLLTNSLDSNIELFKEILKSHEDINYRIIENIYDKKIRICLISVVGMIDKELIYKSIIKPIILTNIQGIDYSKRYFQRKIVRHLRKKEKSSCKDFC